MRGIKMFFKLQNMHLKTVNTQLNSQNWETFSTKYVGYIKIQLYI